MLRPICKNNTRNKLKTPFVNRLTYLTTTIGGGSKTQVTGQVAGQVNRKNIFLPTKLTIFLWYTKIWFYQGSR